MNKNETKTFPNLWDTTKAALRSNLIALRKKWQYLRLANETPENFRIKIITPKRSKQQEVIKLRVEINKNKRINETELDL